MTHPSGTVVSVQQGVFRTNCIDCLDRTNVVQSMLAQRSLQDQLQVNKKIQYNVYVCMCIHTVEPVQSGHPWDRTVMYTNRVFGTAKSVLFIEVSSLFWVS